MNIKRIEAARLEEAFPHLKTFDEREQKFFLEVWLAAKMDVVIPEEMEEYEGHVSAEDGEAGEYYVEGWNACRGEILKRNSF